MYTILGKLSLTVSEKDTTQVQEQILLKGEKICNGAVTKEIGSTTLQICVNGKVTIETTLAFLHISLSPGEADAEEKSRGGFCTGRT